MIPEVETTQGLRDAVCALAKSIAASEYYREFEQAQDAFHANLEARALFQDYIAAERKARLAESMGGLAEAERNRFEDLKKAVFASETLKRMFEAQEKLVAVIKEVNELMTTRLGFDFAAMARPAGSCC